MGMAEDMQQDAIDCATQALEKYNIEKDIAAFIKKEFDKKYNPTWHAIVGRNFGFTSHTRQSISSTSTSGRWPYCSSNPAEGGMICLGEMHDCKPTSPRSDRETGLARNTG